MDGVYDFPQPNISQSYIDKNKIIIEKRLLYAGIRLAAVLDKFFGTDDSTVIQPAQIGNSISADSAINYIGKYVTVCTRVYSVKSLKNVSFINVGAPYPNSPLTIVIFEKDKYKFKPSIEELYNGKNICVKGKVELYKNKPEIIVTSPDEINIQ